MKPPSVRSQLMVFAAALVVGAGALLLTRALPTQARADNADSALVILTASWCGSCREIVPAARNAASGHGLRVVTVDVDDSSAPSTAKGYGISISGSDLPQIYLVNQGRTTLLFTGRAYKFGQARAVQSQIEQRLEGSL